MMSILLVAMLLWTPHVVFDDGSCKWNEAVPFDFDSDGITDIIAGAYSGDRFVLFPGPDYEWQLLYQGMGPAYAIDTHDFNYDGYDDAVIGFCGTAGLRILWGPDLANYSTISTYQAREVRAADFNNDGLMDIGVMPGTSGGYSGVISWLENPSWVEHNIITGYSNLDCFDIAFLDASDTVPGVVCAKNPWGSGEISVVEFTGSSWVRTVVAPFAGPRDIRFADFNKDGHNDFIVGGQGGVQYFINNGDNTFTGNILFSNMGGGGVNAIYYSSDEYMDLLASTNSTWKGSKDPEGLRIYYGPDYSTYEYLVQGYDFDRLWVYDMDNDGMMDILGAAQHQTAIVWMENELVGIDDTYSPVSPGSFFINNPASGMINIHIDDSLIGSAVNVYDLSGRIVSSAVLSSNECLLGVQNPGVHFVQINSQSGMLNSKITVLP